MNKRFLGIIGICFLLICLSLAQSESEFQIAATKNVMVAMRDAIRLSTDIYRPSQNGIPVSGKFPTILVRTPYDRSRYETYLPEIFVPRGYSVVVQSLRGRYGSEGRFRLFRDDPADGFDCAKWISSQSWSDGRIGMLGGSYEGGTQHAMAMSQPPSLQAIVPLVAATNVVMA